MCFLRGSKSNAKFCAIELSRRLTRTDIYHIYPPLADVSEISNCTIHTRALCDVDSYTTQTPCPLYKRHRQWGSGGVSSTQTGPVGKFCKRLVRFTESFLIRANTRAGHSSALTNASLARTNAIVIAVKRILPSQLSTRY